jgi:methionyl-tRNA formyltransferase
VTRVLFLGPPDSMILRILEGGPDPVASTAEPIGVGDLVRERPGILVSHGYRHLVRRPVLEVMGWQAVNLHIALLPWNRGADPNLWSWVEDTPKGVTLHWMDEGLDSGPIIAQRQVDFWPGETLRSSYTWLQICAAALFKDWWPAIRAGRAPRLAQVGGGSFHRIRDRVPLEPLLARGWDTRVAALAGGGVA